MSWLRKKMDQYVTEMSPTATEDEEKEVRRSMAAGYMLVAHVAQESALRNGAPLVYQEMMEQESHARSIWHELNGGSDE